MTRVYRSRSRIVLDALAVIEAEGPVGVTRVLQAANVTHAMVQDLLEHFAAKGWVEHQGERGQWVLTALGGRVLRDLRRVDAVMRDHGLGL